MYGHNVLEFWEFVREYHKADGKASIDLCSGVS